MTSTQTLTATRDTAQLDELSSLLQQEFRPKTEQAQQAVEFAVTTLANGYPAQKAELRSGDVIRSVGGTPVTDLEEFTKLYDASVKAKEERVAVEVQRGRGRRRAVFKVEY